MLIKDCLHCKDPCMQSLDRQNAKNNFQLQQIPDLKVCKGHLEIEQGA